MFYRLLTVKTEYKTHIAQPTVYVHWQGVLCHYWLGTRNYQREPESHYRWSEGLIRLPGFPRPSPPPPLPVKDRVRQDKKTTAAIPQHTSASPTCLDG